jgi:hypothetical protein
LGDGSAAATVMFLLRAISVATARWAMLRRWGRLWRWVGWLGIAYRVEHLTAGVLHHVATQGGVNALLGTVGGLMRTRLRTS